MKKVNVDNQVTFSEDSLGLIVGPCVIESRDHALRMSNALVEIAYEADINLIYKSSFDKANRSSIDSKRGPGIDEGLTIMEEVKRDTGLPVLTDIHESSQADIVKEVIDVIQIPAFLCRQTDLLVAAAETGKIVNIKKGQFLAPWDMQQVVDKVKDINDNLLLTDRGTQFGYNNLVADMRAIPIMKQTGFPVVFDATHSVQLPGGNGKTSGGMREMIPYLAKAATAAGCNGLFFEVHDNPEKAYSDAGTQFPLSEFANLLKQIKGIHENTRESMGNHPVHIR